MHLMNGLNWMHRLVKLRRNSSKRGTDVHYQFLPDSTRGQYCSAYTTTISDQMVMHFLDVHKFL